MAQHDYVIDNQTAANVRSDLNNALAAIVSQNSGDTEPSTTFANMLWYDSANNILKMRNEANDGWINVGELDQSNGVFIVSGSGTSTGDLVKLVDVGGNPGLPAVDGSQLTGIATNEIGDGQSLTDVTASRSGGVAYQNTTGRAIFVMIVYNSGDTEMSEDNVNWVQVYDRTTNSGRGGPTVVLPAGWYIRVTNLGSLEHWVEIS